MKSSSIGVMIEGTAKFLIVEEGFLIIEEFSSGEVGIF